MLLCRQPAAWRQDELSSPCRSICHSAVWPFTSTCVTTCVCYRTQEQRLQHLGEELKTELHSGSLAHLREMTSAFLQELRDSMTRQALADPSAQSAILSLPLPPSGPTQLGQLQPVGTLPNKGHLGMPAASGMPTSSHQEQQRRHTPKMPATDRAATASAVSSVISGAIVHLQSCPHACGPTCDYSCLVAQS